ncbi:hypothetical protein KCV06_g29, partial [Aureobasidium melanogenum]
MNTTSTAAKAAVDAAISNLLAFVHVARTNANRIVNPAIAPIRPPSVLMKYSATIDAMGIAAPMTLINILLNFNTERTQEVPQAQKRGG